MISRLPVLTATAVASLLGLSACSKQPESTQAHARESEKVPASKIQYADASYHDSLPLEPWRGLMNPKPSAPITEEIRKTLEEKLKEVTDSFQKVKHHPHAADVDIFLKAVRFAIDFHEWYEKKPEEGEKKALQLLTTAANRIAGLERNETYWLNTPGMTVLGYYSKLDDAPIPYIVETPPRLVYGPDKPAVPGWVFLHGRFDKVTDLNFIAGGLQGKTGMRFRTLNVIVVHPFGRYCNGFKGAGETDVLECMAEAQQRLNLDPARMSLLGYSMGGAGAWHLGAHFADRWAKVHAGGGFVDVRRYTKLKPEQMPPAYEQTLWGIYDVPDYARNYLNTFVISYDGSEDHLRDGGDYMKEVLDREGVPHRRIVVEGMDHGYLQSTKQEVMDTLENDSVITQPWPDKVALQTRSARYASMYWVKLLEVAKPWEDTRVEAALNSTGDTLTIATKNVLTVKLDVPWKAAASTRHFIIDGHKQEYQEERSYSKDTDKAQTYFLQHQDDNQWLITTSDPDQNTSRKAGGTCIDDAFRDRFTIVLPDRPGRHPETDAWVKTESRHAIERWRRFYRGNPRVIYASELPAKLTAEYGNLILWGDDKSNTVIAKLLAQLPVKWQDDKLNMGRLTAPSHSSMPMLIQAVKLDDQQRFVVLNSGITNREAHDKSNTLQNPKLPDWVLLDITVPPNEQAPGRIKQAGFSDRRWQLIQPE